ncbi:hypothetical protein QTP88_000642 [Uroleucon formosanum]
MEFVTKKNQLARRVNTGPSETQLVGTIAGLTRNEYRTHLRLQRPATFRDLRRITGILEYTPDEPPPPPQPKPENKKFGSANTQRPPHQKQIRDDAAEKPLPSNPCSGRVERTKLIEHDILLKNQTPIALKPYPYPQLKQFTIDTMIRDMKEQELVEQNTSPWAAPVVLAKKKDGSPRLCIDYRRLNDITEYDAYLMPDLNALIRQMRGAKVYSVLDLKSGYWQTDASEIGAGAVLFERGNSPDERRIIAYASKKFSDTQRRYAAVERECLAIIWATDKFRPYLEAHRFDLFTDNSTLTWLHPAKNTNSKLTKWALQLANLDYKTTHVPGVQNEAPDMLSHNPTTEPPVDEERLVGVPTSPLTTTNSSTANNLFATTDPANTKCDSTITHAMLVSWQSNDPNI